MDLIFLKFHLIDLVLFLLYLIDLVLFMFHHIGPSILYLKKKIQNEEKLSEIYWNVPVEILRHSSQIHELE